LKHLDRWNLLSKEAHRPLQALNTVNGLEEDLQVLVQHLPVLFVIFIRGFIIPVISHIKLVLNDYLKKNVDVWPVLLNKWTFIIYLEDMENAVHLFSALHRQRYIRRMNLLVAYFLAKK
jgi:hypothetical protein